MVSIVPTEIVSKVASVQPEGVQMEGVQPEGRQAQTIRRVAVRIVETCCGAGQPASRDRIQTPYPTPQLAPIRRWDGRRASPANPLAPLAI